MPQQHAFITGGAGFIGRWIVDRCLRNGYAVTVYDNFCAGTRENIAEFADQIQIVEGDILDRDALSTAMDAAKPDILFHMAAHHFIPFCDANPDETLRVNVEGSYTVLDVAAQHGVGTAVVASSGAIYPSVDELISEDLPSAPVDVYGLSKLLTEGVCEHIARTTDLQVVAARLFNTYGAFETNPHLIPHIMESLHEGPVVPLGNIHTKRDYIYVEDVAELLFTAATSDLSGYTDNYAVANVGTGIEYSAEEIIDALRSLTGIDIEIKQRSNRKRTVDKLHQRANTQRLIALTGTQARHSLSDGLKKLLAHERIAVPA